MPTTLTLENVPDELYRSLARSAEVNHRTVDDEAIACLERALQSRRRTLEEELESARAIRASLGPVVFDAEEILRAIDEGRE